MSETLARLKAENAGLSGMNHTNYIAKRQFAWICFVLVVALVAISGGAQATLGAIDAVVAWMVSRWWCWPLIALFWLRVALYVRDFAWLGRRG